MASYMCSSQPDQRDGSRQDVRGLIPHRMKSQVRPRGSSGLGGLPCPSLRSPLIQNDLRGMT